MTKCEGIERPGGFTCRIHNVLLQERTIQEDGHDAPDMKAWYCPVSDETAVFNAALGSDKFS